MKKFVCICLLGLLVLVVVGNFMPQVVQATSVENDESLTIQNLPFNLTDVATDGTYLYAGLANGSIFRTTNGESWTELTGWCGDGVYALQVTSNGTLFAGTTSGYHPLYRSVDHGATFSVSMNSSTYWYECLLWNLDEDSDGNLWLATYGGIGLVLKSMSNGAYGSWTLKLNATQTYGAYHMHEIFVDKDTDYIYTSYGDSVRGDLRSTDGGNTWETLPITRGVTAIEKFEGYRYFGHDSTSLIHRTNDDINFEVAMENPSLSFSGVGNAFYTFSLTSANGLLYATTVVPPTIWATWDGLSWAKLFDWSSYDPKSYGLRRVAMFKNWIYIASPLRSFRFPALDKNNLKNIYWYNSTLDGNQVTASQYIYDGMNQSVYLGHVIEDATVKVKALYSENLVQNPSFETWSAGLPTKWKIEGTGMTVTEETTEVLFGSKSAKINQTDLGSILVSDTNVGNDWVVVTPFRWYVVSAYFKSCNATGRSILRTQLRLEQWDEEGGYIPYIGRDSLDLGDGLWHRMSWTVYTAKWVSGQYKGVKYWRYGLNVVVIAGWKAYYVDGFQIQLAEPISNMTKSDGLLQQKTLSHNYTANQIASTNKLLTPFRNYGTYSSSNISFTLNGEAYSFNNVPNGTEMTVASFTSIYGSLDFTNISVSSGIAEISIVGERRVSLEPYAQTYLVSYSFSDETETMTLTINGRSGTTSTTKVFAGDKREPEAVYVTNGTLSWSYNASSEIITLTVLHNDQANILVYWRIPGDVNADGVVNIVDAAGISAHWYPGPSIGPLGYGPNFDINGDGSINILDAGIVSAYWTGPPEGPHAP